MLAGLDGLVPLAAATTHCYDSIMVDARITLQKGQPNGLATLGADGNAPRQPAAQRVADVLARPGGARVREHVRQRAEAGGGERAALVVAVTCDASRECLS